MKIRVPIEKAAPVDHIKEDVVDRESVAYMNSVWGDISNYGTKTLPDGRVMVIHGHTGKPIEREKAVPVSSDGKGNLIYLRPGEKLNQKAEIFASVWSNPTRITL